MGIRVYAIVRFSDIAFGIDDVGISPGAEGFVEQSGLAFTPGPESGGNLMAGIAQDREIKTVSFGEAFMTVNRAPVDADDLGIAELLNNPVLVAEAASLLGAVERVIFRIKVQHDPAAFIIAQ